MAEIALGWDRSKENNDFLQTQGRTFQYSDTPLKPLKEFSARWIINLRNQRNRNSCVGHGLTHTGAACAWLDSQGTERRDFSRWGAYIWSQQMGGMGGRDNGAPITGAVLTASRLGFLDEAMWPYPADNEKYSQREPNGAKAAAKPLVALAHTPMQSHAQCIDWMQQGKGAILGGIDWTERLANAGARITMNDVRGRVIGGHCIFWWGWNEDGDLDLGNSHGEQWGEGGWSWTPPDVMDYFCRTGEIHGISDLAAIDVSRPVIADLGENM